MNPEEIKTKQKGSASEKGIGRGLTSPTVNQFLFPAQNT